METTIDQAGRVVVPKALRTRFHLAPGTRIEITADDNGIYLAPADSGPALSEKQGVLVHRGSEPVNIDIVAFIQSERDRRSVGIAAEQPDT